MSTEPTPQSTQSFNDLVLAKRARPGKREQAPSRVLLARIDRSGEFQLLNAGAWATALGYGGEELIGKSLRELMPLDRPAAADLIFALLDETDDGPLDVILRCRDYRRKSFRLHRRFDAYGEAFYVVAEELPYAGEQTGWMPKVYDTIDESGRPDGPEADPARQPLGQL